ncbi:MAG: hypothetical protein ACO2PN_20640 [Pyrobaculum sp.]|jgi:hypothetical protein
MSAQIPEFFSDPLTAAGLMVLVAQAGAYSLYWFLGDRAHRERAMEGFERVLISGVLFGIALILVNLSLWGLNIYLSIVDVKLPHNSAIQVLNRTEGWWDFGSNVQAALRIAEGTYRSYTTASGAILGAYATAVVATGLTHWTAPVSMAILNVLAFLVTAATTVLILSAVYAVAMTLAHTWPLLLPLGAVMVTYERTRQLGAWLLSVSVVAPIILAAGADLLASAVEAEKLRAIANLDIIQIITSLPAIIAKQIIDSLLVAMIVLGLIGLSLGVLTYAASRLFDHAGASLSLD